MFIKFFFEKYFLVKNKYDFNYIDLVKKTSSFDFGKLDEKEKSHLSVIFEMIDRLKILTVIKEGLSGCNFINEHMKELLFEHFEYGYGYPVIMTRNDYSKNLFNGDTGVILQDRSGLKKAVFKDNDEFRFFEPEFIKDLETGFSITVHKSQGSEYNDVLIVLPDNIQNPLLTKEIIYTALTRSKRNCFVLGKKEVFIKSITEQVERESGIRFY